MVGVNDGSLQAELWGLKSAGLLSWSAAVSTFHQMNWVDSRSD